jgi:hypothetical protein
MCSMAPDVPNQQTRTAVTKRIIAHVAQGWPHLGEPLVRHRGKFCYVGAVLPGSEEPTPILRLRYQGSADRWAIAIYVASKERYTESELPTRSGVTTGTPEEGIDHTFALYAGPSVIATPAPDEDRIVSPTQTPDEDQTTPAQAPDEDQTTPAQAPDEDQTTPAQAPDEDQTTGPAQAPDEDQDVESAEPPASPSDQISAANEPKRRTFPWPRIPIPRLKLWRTR